MIQYRPLHPSLLHRREISGSRKFRARSIPNLATSSEAIFLRGEEPPVECKGCKKVHYCSNSSQKQDWKKHKLVYVCDSSYSVNYKNIVKIYKNTLEALHNVDLHLNTLEYTA